MSVTVIFHELAEAELHEAARYYESEVAGLGVLFLTEVTRSVAHIRTYPLAAPLIHNIVRRKLLRRFPYGIMYSVVGERVNILAIANQKRRPYYWRMRR